MSRPTTTPIALSRWLNTMHVARACTLLHGPGFSASIRPKVTNADAFEFNFSDRKEGSRYVLYNLWLLEIFVGSGN